MTTPIIPSKLTVVGQPFRPAAARDEAPAATPGVSATQQTVITDLDVRRKHEARLKTLNMMAQVINELKRNTCSGVLALSPDGVLDAANERYILNCRRRVPDLGVAVILTRDHSAQLEKNLHLKSCVHLTLAPLADAFLLDFKLKHPAFVQVGELDDTSVIDWVTTAFAPFHEQVWVEGKADGSLEFRLFTDATFGKAKGLWANQERGLREVLHWHRVKFQ